MADEALDKVGSEVSTAYENFETWTMRSIAGYLSDVIDMGNEELIAFLAHQVFYYHRRMVPLCGDHSSRGLIELGVALLSARGIPWETVNLVLEECGDRG